MSLSEVIARIPPVTRTFLASAIFSGLAVRFRLLSPYSLALLLPKNAAQVWRYATNFMYFGAPDFSWLFRLYFIYTFFPLYEENPYPSGPGAHSGNIADFIWMLVFGAGVLTLVGGYLLSLPILSLALFSMVVYVWSRRNPERQTAFYMFRVPAKWLPWVMTAFAFVLGDDPTNELLGIGVGHLYYFLKEVLPTMDTPLRNTNFVRTPDFLYRYLQVPPTHLPPYYQQAAARAQGAAPAAGGLFQGRANVLGR